MSQPFHMLGLKEIKRIWQPLLAVAAWMFVSVGAFLTFPVNLSSTSTAGPAIVGATHAFVAAACGICLLAIRAPLAKTDYRTWIRISVMLLSILIISFLVYVALQASWTCPYARGLNLVIGAAPSQELSEYLQRNNAQFDCGVVLDFAGDTTRMFSFPVLLSRFLALAVTYVIAWFSLAGLVLSLAAGMSVKTRTLSGRA